MNNRFEARTRQNRTTALVLTLLFHVALIGGIYYYNLDHQSEKKTDSVSNTEKQITAKPVANMKHHRAKP